MYSAVTISSRSLMFSNIRHIFTFHCLRPFIQISILLISTTFEESAERFGPHKLKLIDWMESVLLQSRDDGGRAAGGAIKMSMVQNPRRLMAATTTANEKSVRETQK